MVRLLIVLFLFSLFVSCVFPGSSCGRVAFSGYIESPSPHLLSLQVTLPETYGLDGFDLVLNEPEDFGHHDQTYILDVINGEFCQEFPLVVYHISYWLIPPLGPSPTHPPPPVYYVTFSNAVDEMYVVGMDEGNFRYEVYSKSTKKMIHRMFTSWTLISGEYIPVKDSKEDVWHLRIRAQSNTTLQPTTQSVAVEL